MSGHGVPSHASSADQKKIGIIISVIAVLVAVSGAFARNEANQMIVKEVQASNGFAWYQSKRQRSHLNELELNRIEVQLAGEVTPAQRAVLEKTQAKLTAKNQEYETENKEILAKAEAEKRVAEVASHRHHRFEYAEVLLHTAIVLCSLSLLTESRLFFKVGLVATAAGLVLTVLAMLSH